MGVRYPLALDTTLVSTYQRDVALYVTVRSTGPINVRRDQIEFVELATAVDLAQAGQSKVIVHRATLYYATPHLRGTLTADAWVENDLAPGDPVVLATPLSVEEKRKPREDDLRYSRLLIEHLNAHLEHYHKAIWARMDPDRRYMLLDGFVAPGTSGKSVASVVENRVIGVAGNCLILPVAPGYKLDPTYQYAATGEGQAPVSLLDHYKPLTAAPPYRVSVPTRGVFAEAVMGACQSCEKWDERRYWKWEEHPIPEEPTPVVPVATQPPQRSEPGALTPTPFPTPLVSIQTAPAAPEPGATVAGALGLLGKPGLFPNLTGLDQTQQNALQALMSNQESAKHFADKASQLALQAATTKSGPSTIESIKQSMSDGTLDKTTGKQLIADAYRAQISGQPSPDRPANTANNSDLAQAGAAAVRQGRPVKASTDHPDGTSTTVDQRHPTAAESEGPGEGAPATTPATKVSYPPIRSDEAGKTLDTYSNRDFTIFIPQKLTQANLNGITNPKVHVFFTAGSVQGTVGNGVLFHGIRGASNDSDWITIGVRGIDKSSRAVSDAEIIDCLKSVQINTPPSALRLTGHSRGCDSLVASLAPKQITTVAIIDRVVFLDEAVEHDKAGTVTRNRVSMIVARGIPAARIVSYEVGDRSFDAVAKKSVRVPGATYFELDPDCMSAVGCVRVIGDAVALRPNISGLVKGNQAIVDQLAPMLMPGRGGFWVMTTGGQSLTDYCNTHKAAISNIRTNVFKHTDSLLDFINQNDLTTYKPYVFGWGVAAHHFFVAEIAHELTK
jgi:hypothetical protein